MNQYNSLSTLPAFIKPRIQVFKEIALASKTKTAPILKAKQWYGYGKVILGFYKTGFTNIWNNRKLKNELLKEQYHIDLIDYSKGKNFKARIVNGKVLTKYLANEIYLQKVESSKSKVPETNLGTKITRNEYQLVLRTEHDLRRLPIFGLMFVLFEELTPLVCLAFPRVVPTVCILPSIYDKEQSKRQELMKKTVDGDSIVTSFLKQGRVRQLTEDQVRFLYIFFELPWLRGLFQESRLKGLENYRKEILVDNYLMNGQFELLDTRELKLYGSKCGVFEEDVELLRQKLRILAKTMEF